MKAALKAGGDPNAADGTGFTMLHSAAVRDNTAVIAALLDGGADITATTPHGMSAMHLAARSGHPGVITFLAGQGADPDATDANNDTPLHLAVFYGQGDAAVALLQLGVTPGLENLEDRERPSGVRDTEHNETMFKFNTTLGLMRANRLKAIRLGMNRHRAAAPSPATP